MKVYKSEKGCPISFENSLVAKPTTAWLPLLPLAGARGGGDEGGRALVRAGVCLRFLLRTDRRSMLRETCRKTGL